MSAVESAQRAARMTDPIGHSPAMIGMIGGMLFGAIIGAVLLAGAIATGGLLLIALATFAAIGCVAGGGLSGGQLVRGLQKAMSLSDPVTGAIGPTVSPNIRIGNLFAARATDLSVACDGYRSRFHHPNPLVPIAEGAQTVLFNNLPAARVACKLVCGARIENGESTVVIGGPTERKLTVNDPEEKLEKALGRAMKVSMIGVILLAPEALIVFKAFEILNDAAGDLADKIWGADSGARDIVQATLGLVLLAEGARGAKGRGEAPAERPTETSRIGEETKPAEEPAKPAEEPAKPTEEPAKPPEEPTKPPEEPTKPPEEPTKPTEEPAKPAEEPAKPPEEPAKPPEEPTKPPEEPEEEIESRPVSTLSDKELADEISRTPKDNDPTSRANELRYERYSRKGGTRDYEDWYGSSRGGRPGNLDHQADVERNNEQPNDLNPNTPVGSRVPDGVGQPGKIIVIRGEPIDPGPGNRVIVESERFGENGHMVADGRRQIRDIRAEAPGDTIVITDPAHPNDPPVIYRPGEQPPQVDPAHPVRPTTPTHVPYP